MAIDGLPMARSKSSRKSGEVKRQIAALRKRGLTRAKPSGRPGGSAYALIKKLRPVLEKKAAPVKLTKEARKKYAKQFPIAGGKAIIPIARGERVSLSKAGDIRRVKRVGTRKFRFRIIPGTEIKQQIDHLPGDENSVYRITTKNGFVIYRFGQSEAEKFISGYDVGAFVSSIELVNADDMEDDAA